MITPNDFWRAAQAEEEYKKYLDGYIKIPQPLQKYLGNQTYIHRDELDRLRNFLSPGGQIVVPLGPPN